MPISSCNDHVQGSIFLCSSKRERHSPSPFELEGSGIKHIRYNAAGLLQVKVIPTRTPMLMLQKWLQDGCSYIQKVVTTSLGSRSGLG
jgi:hypothetical protein